MAALVTDSPRKTPARLAGSAILACQSDERLVELLRDGHERAFDAIVARYRRPLLNYCRKILPESRTEDAVQQAFINAHAALTSSDDALQLKPWLFTVARNAALNMLRQNGWNYEQIPLDFDGVRRPDQVVEQRIELQRTVDAVNDLPERQRSALVMRELEGRSYEEIAIVLGAGDGAVRQLLNRARRSLRSVATALMPPPILARAAASLPPSDGRRTAEVLGSLGAAGVAKAGATALVAGSLVVGAVSGPVHLGGSSHHLATAANASTIASANSPAAGDASISNPPPAAPGRQHSSAKPGALNSQGGKHRSSLRSGPAAPTVRQRSDNGRNHDTSNDTTRSGDHRGGSDDTSSGDHSSGGSPSSGSSPTSGSDGSTSGSGASGSGSGDALASSGTDGSGTNSGTSGSGTSGGSGSDDGLNSGSGSSGSGTSGSGTSGTSGISSSGTSGSSGSRSADTLVNH